MGPKSHFSEWVHIGATWQTRLNDRCAAAIRLYAELLWPLETAWTPLIKPNYMTRAVKPRRYNYLKHTRKDLGLQHVRQQVCRTLQWSRLSNRSGVFVFVSGGHFWTKWFRPTDVWHDTVHLCAVYTSSSKENVIGQEFTVTRLKIFLLAISARYWVTYFVDAFWLFVLFFVLQWSVRPWVKIF